MARRIDERTIPVCAAACARVIIGRALRCVGCASDGALGLGPHRSIKPDLVNFGGKQEIRALPNGGGTLLHPVASQRTGLIAAAPIGGNRGTQKSRGTSPAAALTTRAILQSAEALTGEDGPYEGRELLRRDLALLTRALAVNAARWLDGAQQLYGNEITRLGNGQHAQAKEEVCRHFGYGVLAPELMQQSPDTGVTLVGLGSIRKDQGSVQTRCGRSSSSHCSWATSSRRCPVSARSSTIPP